MIINSILKYRVCFKGVKYMKKRIISAVVMALIGIPILIIGKTPYVILIALLALCAYKELLDLKKSHGEYPLIVVLFSLVGLMLMVLSSLEGFNMVSCQKMILLISIILLLMSIFFDNDKYDTKDAFYLIGVTLFLGISFNFLIKLRMESIYEVIYVFGVPILNDVFAYFGGMLFGNHKMCKISPKKTWEGAIIGLLFGTTGGVLIQTFLLNGFSFKIIAITMLLSIVGQMGDLFFSKIKRENEIKDFSNLIPGHGGILDRFDSALFVVLAYVALRVI